MSGFVEEVKRRKVYRVAVAYIIVAGGIIQIASAVFPAWELPNWSQRLLIVLLLAGFPIALILAWAFDVTPEGVRVTAPPPSLPAHRRGRRNLFILLGIGLLVSAVAGFFILPRASARKVDKSIAVLPFENRRSQSNLAYFRHVLSRQDCECSRDREAARGFEHSRRQRTPLRQQGAGERAIDRRE